MKTALVIVCSLLLVGIPFLPAQTPSSCAKQPNRACCHGGTMKCCAAQPASSSQSVPAIPTQSGTQNHLSLPAPAILAWTPPASPAHPIAFSILSPLTVTGTPLYARHCVRLI